MTATAAGGGLALRFLLEGDVGRIAIPAARAVLAADGLWAHTCCEAFLSRGSTPAYREFNFSPSGEWAIYDFSDYRRRVAAEPPSPAPEVQFSLRADAAMLVARIPPQTLPAGSGALCAGFAAVVENLAGGKSYWALAHPPGRPDFHHRAGFAHSLRIPP